MSVALYWLIVGLVLIILEVSIPGLFVFLFFGLGAFATALLVYLISASLLVQSIVFLMVSLGGMLFFRKYLKGAFFEEQTRVEQDPLLEDFIGNRVVAINDFKAGQGKVELNGAPWKARCVEAVKKGDLLSVVGKENITLILSKV